MKASIKQARIIFTILSFLIIGCASGQEAGIKFVKDTTLKTILEKARIQKKLIFIDCYTTWCGNCYWMDDSTFANDEVGRFYNEHFINAKFDMEKKTALDILKIYNVGAYPTFLFINSKGEWVYYYVGALRPKRFIEIGDFALKRNLKNKN